MARSLALALLGLVAFAPAAPAAAPADAAAARRLEAAFGSTQALRAEFHQTVTDARGRLAEEAEGTVALQRPGKFRWDYRIPEQLVVSDGATVWFHDIGLEQVTVRPAADALSGTPALLLSGQADLAAEFDVADGGRSGGLDWVVLRPRDEESDFRELRVGLAGNELRRLTLLDRLGQTTLLEFERVERNPRLDPALFTFTPPPGVDVVGRGPAEP